MMIFLNKIYKNDVLMIMLIYITMYKNLMIYDLCCFKIENEHKIMYISLLKLCSLNLIFNHDKDVYNNLLKCIYFINNLLILHMFDDLCFHIVINIKHIKKVYNLRKHLKNCIYKCKLVVSDYEI